MLVKYLSPARRMITAVRAVANLPIFAPWRLCVSIFIAGYRLITAGRVPGAEGTTEISR